MKNRKLPFGYKMEQGKPVVYPREAEIVTVIFRQYTMGASYLTLVKMLKNQPVPYDTNRLWNKNMVARILEDSRYLGQEDFPAVIEEKLFRQAAQKRDTKQVVQLTESQKLLRRLTGQKVQKETERQVLDLLNDLMKKPEIIRQPPVATAYQGEVAKLESNLETILNTQPIDEDAAHQLIRQIAAARYAMLSSEEYETRRIRHIFAEAEPLEELDAGLLKSTVCKIELTGSGTISLHLKNHQIIERSPSPCPAPKSL